MNLATPHHRLARVSLGRALVGIAILALVFTVWRQHERIDLLTRQNQYLRERAPSPDQIALQEQARSRATRDIREWQNSEALKRYNDANDASRRARLGQMRAGLTDDGRAP